MGEGGQRFTGFQIWRSVEAVQDNVDTFMRLGEGNFRYICFRRQAPQGLQKRFERRQKHGAAFNVDNLFAAAPAKSQHNRAPGPAAVGHGKARAPPGCPWRSDQGRHGNVRQATMSQRVADYIHFPIGVGPGGNMLCYTAAAIAEVFARRRRSLGRFRQAFQQARTPTAGRRLSEFHAHPLPRQRTGNIQLYAIAPGDAVTAGAERFYG